MKCELDEIRFFTIESEKVKCRIMNYGCTLLNVWVKNANGEALDVVLGYEDISEYFNNPPCFGSCVLPNANRIEDAKFSLNGKCYEVDKNDGENSLHSGFEPLHKRLWNVDESGDDFVRFSISVNDMDMGFPGNRGFKITYKVEDNRIRIDYEGTSDKDTLFNPTNHSYFNLQGHDNGDILSHELIINASAFTPSDEHSICHGEIKDVTGTPMDFTSTTTIGKRINENFDQLIWGNGYDHNYIISSNPSKPDEELKISAATLTSPSKDLSLNIYTSSPCIQLYTGNYLSSGDVGKGNHPYSARCGVALETQFAPNAINIDSFDKPILKKGETQTYSTIYEFIS